MASCYDHEVDAVSYAALEMPDQDAADDIRSLISFDDLEHNSVTSSIRAGKVRRNWRLRMNGLTRPAT